MSDRGIEFLNRWVHENINAGGFPPENESLVEVLVEKCREDADKVGISTEEIEEDIGDINEFILEALDAGTPDETNRLAAKED